MSLKAFTRWRATQPAENIVIAMSLSEGSSDKTNAFIYLLIVWTQVGPLQINCFHQDTHRAQKTRLPNCMLMT